MSSFLMAVLVVGQVTAMNPFASAQSRPIAYGYAPTSQSLAKFFLSAEERLIVNQTNAERAKAGMPTLAVNAVLMDSSRSHCFAMAANKALYHSQPKGYAENVAAGQNNAFQAMIEWMRSPGHKKNILDPRWRKIGVATCRFGNNTFYCQQFKP